MTCDAKYEGYIARQQVDIQRQQRLAFAKIPQSLDFAKIVHLRAEAREKFEKVRPSIWRKPAASAESRRPTWLVCLNGVTC